jgi:hypothetical protein
VTNRSKTSSPPPTQSRGSVLAILAELDVQIESALKAGRIVHLPNGTHYKPTDKKDGSVDINVRVNPELDGHVNADFRGKWINAKNIGKSEAEIIAFGTKRTLTIKSNRNITCRKEFCKRHFATSPPAKIKPLNFKIEPLNLQIEPLNF